jgi:hypothetical protein
VPQEPEEQLEHVRVRVREEHGIAVLGPLGPIEHAAVGMQGIAAASELAAVVLRVFARDTGGSASAGLPAQLGVVKRVPCRE